MCTSVRMCIKWKWWLTIIYNSETFFVLYTLVTLHTCVILGNSLIHLSCFSSNWTQKDSLAAPNKSTKSKSVSNHLLNFCYAATYENVNAMIDFDSRTNEPTISLFLKKKRWISCNKFIFLLDDPPYLQPYRAWETTSNLIQYLQHHRNST